MAHFIFMGHGGSHIIDLKKTVQQLQEATHALKSIASAGKRVLFVATKKQAKAVVAQEAKRLGMPYITERWLGGTLTNFATIRKSLKKMASFDKLMKEPAYQNMAKKEKLMMAREKTKLERLLQGIADTTRLPSALFIVDPNREHIAVKEAQKLGIPIFAMVDTNTDPTLIDYPISSNDDASRAIELIMKAVGSAIEDGLQERKQHAEEVAQQAEKRVEQKVDEKKGRRVRSVVKVASSETVSAENERPAAKQVAPLATVAAQKATIPQAENTVSPKVVTVTSGKEEKIASAPKKIAETKAMQPTAKAQEAVVADKKVIEAPATKPAIPKTEEVVKPKETLAKAPAAKAASKAETVAPKAEKMAIATKTQAPLKATAAQEKPEKKATDKK